MTAPPDALSAPEYQLSEPSFTSSRSSRLTEANGLIVPVAVAASTVSPEPDNVPSVHSNVPVTPRFPPPDSVPPVTFSDATDDASPEPVTSRVPPARMSCPLSSIRPTSCAPLETWTIMPLSMQAMSLEPGVPDDQLAEAAQASFPAAPVHRSVQSGGGAS